MRNRCLKPDFFKSEKVAVLTRDARLLFAGLWCMADSWGVLEDRPRRIRVELFPYDELVAEQVATWLDEIVAARMAVRYVASGVAYLWLPGLRRHQVGSMPKEERARPPRLPFPPGVTRAAVEAGDVDLSAIDDAEAPPSRHRGTTVATERPTLAPPGRAGADGSGGPIIQPIDAHHVDHPGATVAPQRGYGDTGIRGNGDTGDGRTGSAPPPAHALAASPPAKTHDDPEVRLAPWISIGARDERRAAENRATLASLIAEHGESLVQRVAEAFRHREGRKAYPDQLIEPLALAARADAPPPSDPLDDAVADAIRDHGWERCFTAAGFDAAQIARLPEHARKTEQTPASAAREILRGNRPAARAMLAKLSGAAASGAA